MKAFLAIVSFFSMIALAHAETQYIVDQVKLPLRAGQGTNYSIISMLPSGLAVEILEESAEGYTQIRTPGGQEGWMLTRYLMKMPAARDRLAATEKKLAEYSALKHEKEVVEEEYSRLQADNGTLSNELERIRETSAQAMAIASENKALKIKVDEVELAHAVTHKEMEAIKSGEYQKWFMLGGGAILLGVLLGLILPSLRRRKKSQWGQY